MLKATRPFALAIALLALLVVDWSLWFAGGLTFDDAVGAYLLTNTVIAVTFGGAGAVILAQRPAHTIGRLFLGIALFYTAETTTTGLLSGPYELSASVERNLTILGNEVWTPAPMVLLPLVLQLFPTGSPLSSRWRRLVPTTIVVGLVSGVVLLLQPGPLTDEPMADPSAILSGSAQEVVNLITPVAQVALGVIFVLSLAAMVIRLRRSRETERQQLFWFVWAVGLYVVLNIEREVTGSGPVLLLLTIPLIPVAAMIAIVRHQLYDIRVVINRTFVYGLLTLGIVASYFAVVGVVGQVAHDNLDTNPLIATVLIALAFASVRQRLQKAVDRLMYGESRDPAKTVAHVGAHLTADLDGVLRAVCAAMRLPYAAISSDGRLLASVGDEPQALRTLPLDLGVDAPADLLVGLRRGESDLSAPDRRALETLSGPLSIAVRSVRLSGELRESRTRIVAAREDERRRLRRDLHDGLGTALTAIRLKADAASNLQSSDQERAAALLVELRGELSEAIADVRRLVYGLRPPALDDLGLLGALRQQAEQSWRRERAPFIVTIDAPETIPLLSAAVEVAAYRIATESVTNTLRHGDATTCRISLRFDDALHLEVQDNGPCLPQQWRLGVGLTSMRERAAELGGHVTAGPTDSGGRVHAFLPLEER